MSQASATLFKASGSAADPKAKSAQATLRQLSFLIPNQRISENCTNLIDSQPVNEDTVDEDVVDEDTDVGLAQRYGIDLTCKIKSYLKFKIQFIFQVNS